MTSTSLSEQHVGAPVPALSVTPLAGVVATRRSGLPRDFNCFCVFCNQSADLSRTSAPRTAAHRSH